MTDSGLCKDGEQNHLIAIGATTIAGCLPVNTDGGLIATASPSAPPGSDRFINWSPSCAAGERQVAAIPRVGLAQLFEALRVADSLDSHDMSSRERCGPSRLPGCPGEPVTGHSLIRSERACGAVRLLSWPVKERGGTE